MNLANVLPYRFTMADKGVRDWIDALSLNDAQALEERVVVTDVAGCKIIVFYMNDPC